MSTQIFINLPVKSLETSKAFYEQLGFTINPQFSDETAACVVISDTIYVMLLTHEKFSEFTDKKIADAHKTAQVLTALSAESKDGVNELADKALAAGGTDAGKEDHDFMYGRRFNDPDGHTWEVIWMDMEQVPEA